MRAFKREPGGIMVEHNRCGCCIHQGLLAAGASAVLDHARLALGPDQGRVGPARWAVAFAAVHGQLIPVRRLRAQACCDQQAAEDYL